MLKAKILMLGPCQSGKTVLSNFLSDSTDTSLGDYQPTQGLRILEFEVSASEIKAKAGMEVELWDVSGDKKFEACWPAIARDTNGVVFVYNPDQQNHDKELENWINYFTTAGVRQDQCVIFSHAKPNADRLRSRPTHNLRKITTVQTNLEEDADSVRQSFNKYLSTLLTALSDKREQEELSIINQR
ncbi:hypothetical protein LOTGIDRAFT_231543 [Lottia gigantea]|uniref:Intraflagellar transport protein 22 homolog n=1 Tax=Lottia gigantea TaxID=225164 RepID=V4AJU0_LOTGI|nr:hypothetical protein LOTGIDRAFT_231543 [Lottia gigantea]ESO97347.1 hypothetical protein LOTGIDRAFT_231543 [Lottia gigantea]